MQKQFFIFQHPNTDSIPWLWILGIQQIALGGCDLSAENTPPWHRILPVIL